VQRHLPAARLRPQRFVDQQLFGVAIVAAQGVHHDVCRHEADAQALAAQILGEAAFLQAAAASRSLRTALRPCCRGREVVAALRHEAARFGEGIGLGRAGAAQTGKRLLFAHVGGVEAQHRLGDAG
jgi:hypothetical protein